MLSNDAKNRIERHIEALPESLKRKPATHEEINDFESKYTKIPEDYRWFLLACGGGIFGSEEFDSIDELQKTYIKFIKESEHSKGWTMRDVFIIGWDGSGNPFGIDTSTGKILLEDHTFGGIHQIAENLQEYMLKGIWDPKQL